MPNKRTGMFINFRIFSRRYELIWEGTFINFPLFISVKGCMKWFHQLATYLWIYWWHFLFSKKVLQHMRTLYQRVLLYYIREGRTFTPSSPGGTSIRGGTFIHFWCIFQGVLQLGRVCLFGTIEYFFHEFIP